MTLSTDNLPEAANSNPLLERMRADEPALGMVVRLGRSGEIARLAKLTGHDFIFIDGQHGIFSVETIADIAQTALGCGIAPVARVRGFDDPNVQVLLDGGVTGIIYPDVNTPEQAKRAVEACKFAPLGRRSFAGIYPNFNYAPLSMPESIERLNRTTAVICMIETREALDNVEAIAAIPGIDVLHVGLSDLLIDMGIPGEFGSEQASSAMDKVIAACQKNGIYAGMGGDRDTARQVRYIQRGVRFMSTHSDSAFLVEAADARVTGLRKALSAAS